MKICLLTENQKLFVKFFIMCLFNIFRVYHLLPTIFFLHPSQDCFLVLCTTDYFDGICLSVFFYRFLISLFPYLSISSFEQFVLVIENYMFRADPLAVNREQYSALHLASMYSREDTIKVSSVLVVALVAIITEILVTAIVVAIDVAAVVDLAALIVSVVVGVSNTKF